MWLARSLMRLALWVAVAIAVAVALAVLQAPLRSGGFDHGFMISCYVVGLVYVLLAAIGGSSFSRVADARARARIPGGVGTSTPLSAPAAGEPQLTVTAVLLISGVLLISLGTLLQIY